MSGEMIDHPSHYNSHPSGIEAVDVAEHMSFCLGNCVKYLMRRRHKGDELADLKKAAWYAKRELARLRVRAGSPDLAHQSIFLASTDEDTKLGTAIGLLVASRRSSDPSSLIAAASAIIEDAVSRMES